MKVATRSKIFYALLKVFASCGFGVFRSIIASCLIVERYILKWCSKHIAEILREVVMFILMRLLSEVNPSRNAVI